MQITRHWRLNSQRYRLEGIRYGNGDVSLQQRPTPVNYDIENTVREDREAQVELMVEVPQEHKLAS